MEEVGAVSERTAVGDCARRLQRQWRRLELLYPQSRAYRWGEDGLAGISDNRRLLCFGLALWNGRDPILKERLFGLSNSEGNHGEDVKEYYFYLDSTPTHSYMKRKRCEPPLGHRDVAGGQNGHLPGSARGCRRASLRNKRYRPRYRCDTPAVSLVVARISCPTVYPNRDCST